MRVTSERHRLVVAIPSQDRLRITMRFSIRRRLSECASRPPPVTSLDPVRPRVRRPRVEQGKDRLRITARFAKWRQLAECASRPPPATVPAVRARPALRLRSSGSHHRSFRVPCTIEVRTGAAARARAIAFVRAPGRAPISATRTRPTTTSRSTRSFLMAGFRPSPSTLEEEPAMRRLAYPLFSPRSTPSLKEAL
jgi:hypothetical protein